MDKLNNILNKAEKERNNLNHPYIGTEHLMLAILSLDNDLTDELKKYNLTYNKFKKKLISIVGIGNSHSKYIVYTPMLRKVIDNATNIAYDNNTKVSEKDLFEAILFENEGIAIRVLDAMKIDIDSIVLDNNYMNVDDSEIIFNRENEIKEVIEVLMRKNKCNPILIGNAGVGKTAIVEELARRLKNNKVPNILKGYKIIKIDLSEMIAGTKYRGDFEEKINKVLKKALNEKVILFIDEIHTIIKAGGAEGAIAAGDILKPYLARGNIKCIGATTTNEYHEHFTSDTALSRRFQPIIINETNKEDTLSILKKIKPNYENYHHLIINDDILKKIVDFGIKYQTNKYNPDKSIEMLDSCCTKAIYNEQKEVTINNLYDIYKELYGLDLNDNLIKDYIDNKKILYDDNINYMNHVNYIYIDGSKYKDHYDLYDLLGNPNDYNKKQYYLLKKVIDYPLGIIRITNYNNNKLLKEFINTLINKRKMVDNYGNILNFNNYLIVLDKNSNNNKIGFNIDKKNNLLIHEK